jgi:hypothetical protein
MEDYMARFFKNPADLVVWLKKNCSDAPEASSKMVTLTGSRNKEQDIVESVRRIFANEDTAGASSVLFDILSEYEITELNVKAVNENMHKVVAADALFNAKEITADTHKRMIKESQVMRQGGEYQAMPLRVCPKLPKQSSGMQLISTYNCRHYCLDSLVFDDDPMKVYCAETIWRKHVMDKFSSEWKNDEGEWVGGYINNRFYKFPNAGTPDNPDVERTQGNRMQLAPGERSRQPRPHEFSTERRLEEQREKGSTKSITVLPSKTASVESELDVSNSIKTVLAIQAEQKGFIKLASLNQEKEASPEDKLVGVFGRIVDLSNSGLDSESVAATVVKETGWGVEKVIKLQSIALRKMKIHQADVYSIIMGKKSEVVKNQIKTAQVAEVLLQTPSDRELSVMTQNGQQTVVNPETILLEKGENAFEIYDADSMQSTGTTVSLVNPDDRQFLRDFNEILNGFEETGEG